MMLVTFLDIVFQVLYVLCLNEAPLSGERLQDHWSSGFILLRQYVIWPSEMSIEDKQ